MTSVWLLWERGDVWHRGWRWHSSEVLPVHYRQELPPPSPLPLFWLQKRAVKGQSTLCCLPYYLQFIFSQKIPIDLQSGSLSTSWTHQNLFKLNVYFKYIYALITTLEVYGTPRLHLLVFCLKQLLHPSGWIYTITGPQKTDELPLTWLSYSALFSLALTLFSLGSISMWCSYLMYVVKIKWVSYLDLESGASLFS